MPVFRAEDLRGFAAGLLTKLGMDADMARAMAARVIDAELLGHRTHGLLFFPNYLDRIEKGHIARAGAVDVVADHGNNFAWKANRLPARGDGTATPSSSSALPATAWSPPRSQLLAIGCPADLPLPFTDCGLMSSSATNRASSRWRRSAASIRS
jgi:hypothetical protein